MPIDFTSLLNNNPGPKIVAQEQPSGQTGGELGSALSGLASFAQSIMGKSTAKAPMASPQNAVVGSNPIQAPQSALGSIFGSTPALGTSQKPIAGAGPLLGLNKNAQVGLDKGIVASKGIWSSAMKIFGAHEGDPTLTSYLQKANPNLDPTKTPWCAGFVGSVLNASGVKGTGSLAARSYLNYGTPTKTPAQGDIVVLSRSGDPSKGHVGFFAGYDDKGNVKILGGNQGDQVSIKSFPAYRVLGFRQPPKGAEVEAFAKHNNIPTPGHLANFTRNDQQFANNEPKFNPPPGQIGAPAVPDYEKVVRELDQGHDSYSQATPPKGVNWQLLNLQPKQS